MQSTWRRVRRVPGRNTQLLRGSEVLSQGAGTKSSRDARATTPNHLSLLPDPQEELGPLTALLSTPALCPSPIGEFIR